MDSESKRGSSSVNVESVVGILKECGFEPTGATAMRVDFERLKRSGALVNYRRMLDEKIYNVDDVDVLILHELRMKRIDELKLEDWYCRVGIVQGCAGSGKTTGLLKARDANPGRTIVVAHDSNSLNDVFHGVSGVYTPLDLLTRNEKFSEPHVLLVDEYTKMHMCEILCCAAFVDARVVVLFGDPKQGLSSEDGSELHYSFPVLAKSNVTHRLPKSGVDFLNRVTGSNMKAAPGAAEGSFEQGPIEDDIPEDAVVLVFSETSKRILEAQMDGIRLVSEVQGCTFDRVALYIFESDCQQMADPNLMEVALTRHRVELVLRFESADLYAKLVNRMVKNCCTHSCTSRV